MVRFVPVGMVSGIEAIRRTILAMHDGDDVGRAGLHNMRPKGRTVSVGRGAVIARLDA